VRLVDKRASFLGMDKSLNEVALDKYSFIRDAYLQRRLAAIQSKSEYKDNDGDDGYDKGQNSQ
jgi:phospholipid-binding lipoprotein MlaA